MADPKNALLGAFAAIEGAHFYSSFLPSIMTIEKFATDEEARRALRTGEVLATAFAISLGYTLSELIEDPAPLWFSVITAALMLTVYELAIRGKLNTMTAALVGAGAVLPIVPP